MVSGEKKIRQGAEDTEMTEGGVGRMRMDKLYEGTEEHYWPVGTSGEEPGLWNPNSSTFLDKLLKLSVPSSLTVKWG